MKMRYGFVSNSSSSSFILAMNNKVTNVEKLKLMLLVQHHGTDFVDGGWTFCVSNPMQPGINIDVDYYVGIIAGDLKATRAISAERAYAMFKADKWFDAEDILERREINEGTYDRSRDMVDWPEHDRKVAKVLDEIAPVLWDIWLNGLNDEAFIRDATKVKFYTLEYGDTDGVGAILEHSDLLNGKNWIYRINKH